MDKALEPSDGDGMTCERCKELEAALDLSVKRIEWEAEQHAKKCVELEDMKAEREALERRLDAIDLALERDGDTLRANNAALRAELQTAVNIFGDMAAYGKIGPIDDPSAYYIGEDTLKLMHEALASTPADSLSEYRNGVLEEAAKKADRVEAEQGLDIGEAIRAMKTGVESASS